MKQGKLGLVFNKFCGVGGGRHSDLFEGIISLQNLFAAWKEFQNGKKKKADVLEFAADAEEWIFELYNDLNNGTYRHGGYFSFLVKDPKLRRIHKASVRDRLLHHAVHRILYPYFEKKFIFDSYSSRKEKGTCAAIRRFRSFAWKLSQNRSRIVWTLKIDVRKFFDSVNQELLINLLRKQLPDSKQLFVLLADIIGSFNKLSGKGIPLGNLTSQLFSNVYLNPLDQYVKRRLGAACYLRYADDIFVIGVDEEELRQIAGQIRIFLAKNLNLEIHQDKMWIKKWTNDIDVLGLISSPSKTKMRSKTSRRMFSRICRTNCAEDFLVQCEALYARIKFER